MKRIEKIKYVDELLELFYPVHYVINMAIENAMREKLSRKEAAILWLLHFRSRTEDSVPRKEVYRRLEDWFDASSSGVTKALDRLSNPSNALVRVFDEPRSRREKRVMLTPKGKRTVENMLAKGHAFIAALLDNVSDGQIRLGLEFMRTNHAVVNAALTRGFSKGFEINGNRKAQAKGKARD